MANFFQFDVYCADLDAKTFVICIETDTFKEIRQVFCDRYRIPYNMVNFTFKGQIISDQTKPSDLGIQNDEYVEAILLF